MSNDRLWPDLRIAGSILLPMQSTANKTATVAFVLSFVLVILSSQSSWHIRKDDEEQ